MEDALDDGPDRDDPWVHTGSIYRSPDLLRRDRDADTGELPPYDPGYDE